MKNSRVRIRDSVKFLSFWPSNRIHQCVQKISRNVIFRFFFFLMRNVFYKKQLFYGEWFFFSKFSVYFSKVTTVFKVSPFIFGEFFFISFLRYKKILFRFFCMIHWKNFKKNHKVFERLKSIFNSGDAKKLKFLIIIPFDSNINITPHWRECSARLCCIKQRSKGFTVYAIKHE